MSSFLLGLLFVIICNVSCPVDWFMTLTTSHCMNRPQLMHSTVGDIYIFHVLVNINSATGRRTCIYLGHVIRSTIARPSAHVHSALVDNTNHLARWWFHLWEHWRALHCNTDHGTVYLFIPVTLGLCMTSRVQLSFSWGPMRLRISFLFTVRIWVRFPWIVGLEE